MIARLVTITSIFTLVCMVSRLDALDRKYPDSMFGSAENYRIIKSAEVVSAYRVTPPHEPNDTEAIAFDKIGGVDELRHYKIGSETKIDRTTLSELRKIITDPNIDDPDLTKGCIPIWEFE